MCGVTELFTCFGMALLYFTSLLSGTVYYQPPKLNQKKIYEGGPTTVWQLGGILYDMLVGDKRFNTQMFLLDESPFLNSLKRLNVTEGIQNNAATDKPLLDHWGFPSNRCVVLCPLSSQAACIFSKCVWMSTPRSVRPSKNWRSTPGLNNPPDQLPPLVQTWHQKCIDLQMKINFILEKLDLCSHRKWLFFMIWKKVVFTILPYIKWNWQVI